jgi:hypothetical protein
MPDETWESRRRLDPRGGAGRRMTSDRGVGLIFGDLALLWLTVAHKKSARAIRTTRGPITVRMANALDQRLQGFTGFDPHAAIRTTRD